MRRLTCYWAMWSEGVSAQLALCSVRVCVRPSCCERGCLLFPAHNLVSFLACSFATGSYIQSKAQITSGHIYVASAYPAWKQDTLAHLRGCLEANGGKEFAPDVMKGIKVT